MAGEIERKLNEAGYHMLSKDNKIERLILSILKTKNTRYLKSIPFLIYKYNPNIESLFEKTKENNLFANIIHITKEIFHELNIEIKIPEINYKNENLNYNEFRE